MRPRLPRPRAAFGYLTINALSAAGILLVLLGASFLEFDLTGRAFDMLHPTFASVEDGENRSLAPNNVRGRGAPRRAGWAVADRAGGGRGRR